MADEKMEEKSAHELRLDTARRKRRAAQSNQFGEYSFAIVSGGMLTFAMLAALGERPKEIGYCFLLGANLFAFIFALFGIRSPAGKATLMLQAVVLGIVVFVAGRNGAFLR